jgi:hypothetical protein
MGWLRLPYTPLIIWRQKRNTTPGACIEHVAFVQLDGRRKLRTLAPFPAHKET